MFETLDKILLAGLGAATLTREKAEKIFDEYVARGQAERGTKSGFVKEMMDHADKARKDLEKMISEQVQAAVEQAGPGHQGRHRPDREETRRAQQAARQEQVASLRRGRPIIVRYENVWCHASAVFCGSMPLLPAGHASARSVRKHGT